MGVYVEMCVMLSCSHGLFVGVCVMQGALCRLTYLLDVHSFAEDEMDINRVTLLLPKELDPIFIENERVRGEGEG